MEVPDAASLVGDVTRTSLSASVESVYWIGEDILALTFGSTPGLETPSREGQQSCS